MNTSTSSVLSVGQIGAEGCTRHSVDASTLEVTSSVFMNL